MEPEDWAFDDPFLSNNAKRRISVNEDDEAAHLKRLCTEPLNGYHENGVNTESHYALPFAGAGDEVLQCAITPQQGIQNTQFPTMQDSDMLGIFPVHRASVVGSRQDVFFESIERNTGSYTFGVESAGFTAEMDADDQNRIGVSRFAFSQLKFCLQVSSIVIP